MIAKGIYKHYKGNLYRVLGSATHSETMETLVVYEELKKGGLWVRPAKMFDENVIIDGIEVKRFKYFPNER
jgi:hypothetical protein